MVQNFPNSDQVEEAYYVLFSCLLKLREPEKAYEHYKQLSHLAPDSVYLTESLRDLADYYKDHRSFEKVHEILEELLVQTKKQGEKWSIKMSRVEIFFGRRKKIRCHQPPQIYTE